MKSGQGVYEREYKHSVTEWEEQVLGSQWLLGDFRWGSDACDCRPLGRGWQALACLHAWANWDPGMEDKWDLKQ